MIAITNVGQEEAILHISRSLRGTNSFAPLAKRDCVIVFNRRWPLFVSTLSKKEETPWLKMASFGRRSSQSVAQWSCWMHSTATSVLSIILYNCVSWMSTVVQRFVERSSSFLWWMFALNLLVLEWEKSLMMMMEMFVVEQCLWIESLSINSFSCLMKR